MEQRNDSTGQQREKTLRSNAIALVRNLSGDQPTIIISTANPWALTNLSTSAATNLNLSQQESA